MWTGGFRRDLQGIRAVALALVLAIHAGVPFATGGFIALDMFFVLSGFLITGLLVAELERTGTINVGKFYARRVKRIIPMAIVVLLASVVVAQNVVNPARSEPISHDIIAAAAHVVNWRFAAQSVDYFAPEVIASPVQHYWSLSVEEQFYAAWPALLLLATLFFRRSGRNFRPGLWAVVAIPAILSLAYSIWYTSKQSDPAYFSTLTRAWELALGGALVLMPRPNISRRLGGVLTFGGFAAIGYAFLGFDAATPYPGSAALFPVLGTVAIIVAGSSPHGLSLPGRVLASRPFNHFGDISYGFYLWHWPILAFAADVWGPLRLWQSLLLGVGFAWILTEITYRTIEQPFRYAAYFTLRPRRGFVLWGGGAATAIAAALLLVWFQPSIPTTAAGAVAGADLVEQGKVDKIETRARGIRPDPKKAGRDRGPLPEDGCFPAQGETEHPECAYGDADSNVTVIVFGDSKANAMFPAFLHLAKKYGWRLIGLAKPTCRPIPHTVDGELVSEPDCIEWRDAAYERIEKEKPTLVAIGANRPSHFYEGDTPEAREREGTREYIEVLERLRATGAQVAVLKDPPQAPFKVPECVSESVDNLKDCWFPVPSHHDDTFAERAVEAVDGTHLIDVTPTICPEGICRGVIGGALVYRDEGHMTATFSETTAPVIDRQLPRMR